jgi:uncharacterized protein (TIGR02284 family)
MFEAAARRCDEGATELEAEIRRLGGEPAASGASSRLDQHQIFNHWKGRTRGAGRMRAWRRRGKKHEAALKEDLPPDVKAIVRRQYEGVKANHDRIRDLRNQTGQASS